MKGPNLSPRALEIFHVTHQCAFQPVLRARYRGALRICTIPLLSSSTTSAPSLRSLKDALRHFTRPSESPCHLRNSAKHFSSIGLDKLLDLPRSCPGCGAFTQNTSPDQPGFYGANRKAVQAFIAWSRSKQVGLKESTLGKAPESTYRFFPQQPNGDQGLDFSKGLLQAFGRVTRR